MATIYFIILPFLALIIIVSTVIEIVRRHRRMQQQMLLCSLAATVDRGVPLVQTLDASAREIGGLYGAQVAKFAHLLNQGMVVSKALFLPHQVFPDEVLPLLMVGFATGTPGTALRRALEILRSRRRATALLVRLVHFVLFLLVYTGIMGFLLLYIAPKFVVIFRDFHIELPPVTRWFIEFFRWSQHPLSLFVWGIIVVLLWLGIYYLLRIFNAVSWDPPGIRRLTWRPHTAAVLDGLALAVENQRPLPECLGSLAQKYPQQSIRTRLHRVAEDLQANVACWDSLHRWGLIGRADRTLLEAAQRAGNLAWALGEVAASQRRRWMAQLNVIANLLYPAIILAMGILVLWTMVAFFTPLVYLIKGLA